MHWHPSLLRRSLAYYERSSPSQDHARYRIGGVCNSTGTVPCWCGPWRRGLDHCTEWWRKTARSLRVLRSGVTGTTVTALYTESQVCQKRSKLRLSLIMLACDRAGLGTLDLKPAAALDIRDRKRLAPLRVARRSVKATFAWRHHWLGGARLGNLGLMLDTMYVCMYISKSSISSRSLCT